MSVRLRGAIVAVAAIICAAANAQVPPARPGAGTGGMGDRGDTRSLMSRMPREGEGDARIAGANFVELVNLRLSQLEEDLVLRPNQIPLWNTYKERVMQLLKDQQRGIRVSASETTAPKRLDALADNARNRLTAVEDIADAGKALYAMLTPEQQAIADRRLSLPLATLTGNDSSGGSDLRAKPSLPAPPKEK